MATWVLVPCLSSLRAEFNAIAPGRDRASDGSIGDAAHFAGGTSDHIPDEQSSALRGKDTDSRNEVHAIDVDKDLRAAGWTMQKAVQIIVTRHRTGRDNRLQYVIFDGKIWSASWGWTARKYTGSNPHDKHAHFSSRYGTSQENNTRPWGLLAAVTAPKQEDDGMADITQERFTTLLTQAMHTGKIGKSGQTFAQALDQIDQTLNRVTALGQALAAFVEQEGIDDAEVVRRLTELREILDTAPPVIVPDR